MLPENENVSRIQSLRNTAKLFLEKSLACTKLTDVKAFFDLSQQASASADDLENNLKVESCWTYLHFVRFFGYSPKYPAYLEFCTRNRFSPVAEPDLNRALSYQNPNTYSAETVNVRAVQ